MQPVMARMVSFMQAGGRRPQGQAETPEQRKQNQTAL